MCNEMTFENFLAMWLEYKHLFTLHGHALSTVLGYQWWKMFEKLAATKFFK